MTEAKDEHIEIKRSKIIRSLRPDLLYHLFSNSQTLSKFSSKHRLTVDDNRLKYEGYISPARFESQWS